MSDAFYKIWQNRVTIFGFDIGVEKFNIDSPWPPMHQNQAVLKSLRPFWRRFAKVEWIDITERSCTS